MNSEAIEILMGRLEATHNGITSQLTTAMKQGQEWAGLSGIESVTMYDFRDINGGYILAPLLAAKAQVLSAMVQLELARNEVKVVEATDEPDDIEADFEDIRKGIRKQLRETMRTHYKRPDGQACFCGWQFRVTGGGFSGHYADVIVGSGIFDSFLPKLNADPDTDTE